MGTLHTETALQPPSIQAFEIILIYSLFIYSIGGTRLPVPSSRISTTRLSLAKGIRSRCLPSLSGSGSSTGLVASEPRITLCEDFLTLFRGACYTASHLHSLTLCIPASSFGLHPLRRQDFVTRGPERAHMLTFQLMPPFLLHRALRRGLEIPRRGSPSRPARCTQFFVRE